MADTRNRGIFGTNLVLIKVRLCMEISVAYRAAIFSLLFIGLFAAADTARAGMFDFITGGVAKKSEETRTANSCAAACRSAHNDCRIRTKGSGRCDAQLQRCLQRCLKR